MTADVLPYRPAVADQANGVRRWPAAPAFIEPIPTGLQTFASLAELADHVLDLLAGRAYELVPGSACFAHTDTFPKVTVYTRAPTRVEQQWIGAAVLLSPGGRLEDLDLLEDALTEAEGRRIGRAQ